MLGVICRNFFFVKRLRIFGVKSDGKRSSFDLKFLALLIILNFYLDSFFGINVTALKIIFRAFSVNSQETIGK